VKALVEIAGDATPSPPIAGTTRVVRFDVVRFNSLCTISYRNVRSNSTSAPKTIERGIPKPQATIRARR
jgi:hypothetical protein